MRMVCGSRSRKGQKMATVNRYRVRVVWTDDTGDTYEQCHTGLFAPSWGQAAAQAARRVSSWYGETVRVLAVIDDGDDMNDDAVSAACESVRAAFLAGRVAGVID